MKNKRKKKQDGFARTKNVPHKRHPANYRKLNNDDIEYITFTHHDVVTIDGKKYITIPLSDNIEKKVQEKNKGKDKKEISYAYPKVFVGKRSALGSESNGFYLNSKDKETVDYLFKILPKEKVKYSSNSRKAKKKKT